MQSKHQLNIFTYLSGQDENKIPSMLVRAQGCKSSLLTIWTAIWRMKTYIPTHTSCLHRHTHISLLHTYTYNIHIQIYILTINWHPGTYTNITNCIHKHSCIWKLISEFLIIAQYGWQKPNVQHVNDVNKCNFIRANASKYWRSHKIKYF